MEKLKPCPFCGKDVRLMWFDGEHQGTKAYEDCDEADGHSIYVYCAECDMQAIFSTPTMTARSIIEVWNRRNGNV